MAIASSTSALEPQSLAEALSKSDHRQEWIKAMEAEHSALALNKTYSLVPLPEGRRPVATRWIYRVKHRADGSIERFKARWVAKGFSQLYGIDYDETFSPVVRLENLRMLLAFGTIHSYEIHQMDVDSAFLNAELHEEIYVTQPEGFISEQHPDYVCRLHKSLYGLKQAPLLWNRTIDGHLRDNGFAPIDADPCIYLHRTRGNQIALIALYVDDCTIVAPSELLPFHQTNANQSIQAQGSRTNNFDPGYGSYSSQRQVYT